MRMLRVYKTQQIKMNHQDRPESSSCRWSFELNSMGFLPYFVPRKDLNTPRYRVSMQHP